MTGSESAGEQAPSPATSMSGRTAWSRKLRTPLRAFLRTESGSAAVLLAATIGALVWANVDDSSYERVWSATLSIDLAGAELSLDLREWVNSGLMTFFFFVIGLEARREFDLGEFRDRRRFVLPLLAAGGGMALAVAIFIGVNAGTPHVHGWGVVLSTDTAFALGVLALVGPRVTDRLRVFLLTMVVVDDLVALVVIALFYSEAVSVPALLVAVTVFGGILVLCAVRVRRAAVYLLLAATVWLALLESGIEPVVLGLALGLLTYAYPAARGDLERATERFREFREQPTAQLARSVGAGVRSALSPNDRLQLAFHPWTSYVIVPLFALANAGIPIGAEFLSRAFTSPIALGILLGFAIGKPVAIVVATWLVARLSGGRARPPIGWGALAGTGTIAGIGFTVAIFVATIAFTGPELDEAKAGILSAALVSSVVSWLVFRVIAMLPRRRRIRALYGTAEPLTDLAIDVDPERDHIRGLADGPVTVVEYGDFECPYCGRAEPIVRELLSGFADVRYVWRHLPLTDVHPRAQLAAEAAEAAADQDAFWPMHDLLLAHQDALRPSDLVGYAEQLGLDVGRFTEYLREHAGARRVAEDVEGADLSGVSGTPTFFINGRRHYGAYDITTLSNAVRAAGARVALKGVTGT
jgi:Na+/H+ antiporter NhaA